jgi:hypothetical protein
VPSLSAKAICCGSDGVLSHSVISPAFMRGSFWPGFCSLLLMFFP